jgi:DNA polymerase-4
MIHESERESATGGPGLARHILHADLDAFYAAVEQLDNPELRGKPVLVGGRPEDRGVVATASYEARRFGVHSAMPMRSALRRCPQGIIVRPRFDRYREVSDRVMGIFHDLTGLVEPLSLDEAYLDITDLVLEGSPPLRLALDLKRRVKEETGLILSVGAATSKSVAKIASDLNKPDGLVVILPGEEAAFLAPMPVGRLWGIGPKTAERLRQEGIESIGQMASQPMEWFTQRFGQRAAAIRAKALGEDREPVHTERVTKSVSAETTFANDLGDPAELNLKLAELAGKVAGHLRQQGLQGRTVTVKARLADFTTFTRQATLPAATAAEPAIRDTAWRLLSLELQPGRSFRLLGVGVSRFEETEGARQLQLPLFEDGTGGANAATGRRSARI